MLYVRETYILSIAPNIATSNLIFTHLQVDKIVVFILVSWFDFWNPFPKKHQFGESFFTEALPRMPGSADVPRLRLRLRFTGAGDGDGKAEKAGGGVNGGLGGSGGAGRLQWFACFPFGKRHLPEGFFESNMMKNVWQFLWECWSTSIETDQLRFLVEACSGF